MDSQLLTLGRVFACGGFFGLLGLLFGGLVGHLAWKRGKPAGSGAGLAVARTVARLAGHDSTPGRTGMLVGAIDGLVFLGLSGVVLGLFASKGHFAWATVSRLAFGFLILVGGAVFFGGLAMGIIYAGSRSLAVVFAAGMMGAAGGALVARTDGIVAGAVGGLLAGTLLGLANRGSR